MAEPPVRTLTQTEAAALALLSIEGERSGYDLLKQAEKSIGHVWAPARSQLYATLNRLVAPVSSRGASSRRPRDPTVGSTGSHRRAPTRSTPGSRRSSPGTRAASSCVSSSPA